MQVSAIDIRWKTALRASDPHSYLQLTATALPASPHAKHITSGFMSDFRPPPLSSGRPNDDFSCPCCLVATFTLGNIGHSEVGLCVCARPSHCNLPSFDYAFRHYPHRSHLLEPKSASSRSIGLPIQIKRALSARKAIEQYPVVAVL